MDRIAWDVTWMNVADAVARRGNCERAQVGAVIVTPENRIVATGYNGPPATLHQECELSCPRYLLGQTSPGYDNCITIHAEANALMFCDRRDRLHGTLFATTTICMTCAKLIANSGLRSVVMRIDDEGWHRHPKEVSIFLKQCGLEVSWVGSGIAGR